MGHRWPSPEQFEESKTRGAAFVRPDKSEALFWPRTPGRRRCRLGHYLSSTVAPLRGRWASLFSDCWLVAIHYDKDLTTSVGDAVICAGTPHIRCIAERLASWPSIWLVDRKQPFSLWLQVRHVVSLVVLLYEKSCQPLQCRTAGFPAVCVWLDAVKRARHTAVVSDHQNTLRRV